MLFPQGGAPLEFKERIENLELSRASGENYGLSKISRASDVTEDNGLVLGVREKNAAAEGTIMNVVERAKENLKLKAYNADIPISVSAGAHASAVINLPAEVADGAVCALVTSYWVHSNPAAWGSLCCVGTNVDKSARTAVAVIYSGISDGVNVRMCVLYQ